MMSHQTPRRHFIRQVGLGLGCLATVSRLDAQGAVPPGEEEWHIATNQYPWGTFYGREGRDFGKELDKALAEIKSCGIDGYEPLIGSPADMDRLGPLLKQTGLQMRSFYVNSTLHLADQADQSIAQILTIAEKAKASGGRIVVTNPNPIQWGSDEGKSDAQLRFQAEALNQLGQKLKALDMTLAYHNHDVELRYAAREFHHMMNGTDPDRVTLCLDAHWIYRGAGNSHVALNDIVKLYGRRVSELHIRQSKDGVWTEALGEGDIDYVALSQTLRELGVHPHLVLEQAVEGPSPNTMTGVEAHRRSVQYARKVFQ